MSVGPSHEPLSRRRFLAGGASLGAGVLWPGRLPSAVRRARSIRAAGSDIGAIDHVVFVMQENRSFDHYFGSYRGARGFADHPEGSDGVFAQPYLGNTSSPPLGYVLPFRLNAHSGRGECTADLAHEWAPQHHSWHDGAMDGFVETHTLAQVDGPERGLLTMGYYTRADLPFHYALADAFTLCDGYHCSIMGPTHPNRLMALSGTIDPSGAHGGPVITTNPHPDAFFSVDWTTAPELLEDAGVTWKTYTTPGQGYVPGHPELGMGDAILPYFRQYRSPRSPLFQRAFWPTFPSDLANDVRHATLPQVSWITPPDGYDEHPPAPPAFGAYFLNQVLRILTSNPAVWSRTALFITYDENDGFFDHVAPPTPPPGTPGEFLNVSPLPAEAGGIPGPLGLGFRVPMLVVSPFSRGGRVVSEVFDHTSQLRLLEERFGISVDALSSWRRSTVGDLTATLTGPARVAVPRLPATAPLRRAAVTVEGCSLGDVRESAPGAIYPLPATQRMPVAEAR